jgi:hypothetical protein
VYFQIVTVLRNGRNGEEIGLQTVALYIYVSCVFVLAARSKAWAFGRALTGIVGSNPIGGMGVCLLRVFVLSGRGLSDGLITRPAEYYRLWCVSECDLETSKKRRPGPNLGCCATGKETNVFVHLKDSHNK